MINVFQQTSSCTYERCCLCIGVFKLRVLIWQVDEDNVLIDVLKQAAGCGNEVYQSALANSLSSCYATQTERHRVLVRENPNREGDYVKWRNKQVDYKKNSHFCLIL